MNGLGVPRYLRAFLIAPLAVPALYWAIALVGTLADPDRQRQALNNPLGGVQYVLAVAIPFAYAATLIAAVPAVWLLRHAGRRGLSALLGLGGIVGLVTALLLRPYLGRDLFSVPLPLWEGAALGAVSAGVFWWLAAGPVDPTAARH